MRKLTFLLVLWAFFSSCESGPKPIKYGQDECHWCQMRIMDPKFGTEAITDKGRTYKFDSAECLLHYVNQTDTKHDTLLVTDFERAETFINAKSSWYLVSENMPSPMGGNLNAFSSKASAEYFLQENGGQIYSWTQILDQYSQ